MTTYEKRVRALEAQGITRSDAQGIVAAEDMKRAKHTPGPWSIERTSDHGAAYRVMDEQEVTVALVYQQPYDTWAAKDNAALIASAPDLLIERDRLRAVNAALVAALDTCEAALRDHVQYDVTLAQAVYPMAQAEHLQCALCRQVSTCPLRCLAPRRNVRLVP